MRNMPRLALAFAALMAVLSSAALGQVELDPIVKVEIPAFQATALSNDEPIRDLLLEKNGTLWLLGRTALWRWTIGTRDLKRLRLKRAGDQDTTTLKRLGTDGVNLFAASDMTLYQVQWDQGRIYRYGLGSPAKPLGFAGRGDHFWLLHQTALFRFDRYGKILRPIETRPNLKSGDRVAFDAKSKILWTVRGKTLRRQDLAAQATKLENVFAASHALRGIAFNGSEILTHTAHTVLRHDLSGKLKASIPVEGHRRLLLMSINDDAHAYLFQDHLLEIYQPGTRMIRRHHLPLADVAKREALSVAGSFVALVGDGKPLVFTQK